MGRSAKVWWRESHSAYYTTINGKKRRLSEDKKEAERIFHSLMIQKGKVDLTRETVAQLCDIYLCNAENRLKPLTLISYRTHLQDFCDSYGTRIASDLKPIDLTHWVDSHDQWSRNTRTLATTVVKIWSKWCKRQKCLDVDPFGDVQLSKIVRRKPPARGTLDKFLENILNPRFRDFMELLILLGTRPGELRTLAASTIDLEAGIATVNGRRGERRVMLPDRARAILEPLMKQWPEGPVMRNTIDKPWSYGSINSQIRSIRKRAGVEGVVPYHARGAFATRGIRNGVNPVLVSKLMGHADPTIVYKYYEQFDEQDLKKAVEQAARTTSPDPPEASSP